MKTVLMQVFLWISLMKQFKYSIYLHIISLQERQIRLRNPDIPHFRAN